MSRSHIAARRPKISQKKKSHRLNRTKHHWKRIQSNGSKKSALLRKKETKEKRDLVSIVPNHRSLKSIDQNNDIILDTGNVAKTHANAVKEEMAKIITGATEEPSSNLNAETKGNC